MLPHTIHITKFRIKHPELIPSCQIDGCETNSQFIGTYFKETGHPRFRKYCGKHHERRRKVYQKKMETYDGRKAPACLSPGCRKRGTLLGTDENGEFKYSRCCVNHGFSRPYLVWRKNYCENTDSRLGFKCTTTIIDMRWQLEVDHIDENHSNSVEENCQTLCACCHRIKTKYYREGNQGALDLMLEYIEKGRNSLLQTVTI